MNSDELREALAKLKLSQMAGARLFRVNPTTMRRWCSGDQDIQEGVAIALRLMIKFKVKPEEIKG